MASIPQRELRNNVSDVLRRAESGERLTITVSGRAVAELGPPSRPRQLAPGATLEALLADTPVDAEWTDAVARMRAEDGEAATDMWDG